ncbi:dihydrolipoyllysine-residue succinyltransferase component of 2-oxoglutarate dehydrogenase complex, mitochondrial-like [Aethina tumida]|uniref:dihydrolipoyllysine-residue succinyltransferase component of 2-oxoglutarate dehydrogenase complex, mitochondrial-like n=1 Tax=Aethina tumida TaxID=116153 RepID=UPI00096B578B|nr:dihydrolipoyllysine-residue succinyltransferase component of 2-oxoglutarate dehydrogenase complex, mitochondrial-like [Aethina tumida]
MFSKIFTRLQPIISAHLRPTTRTILTTATRSEIKTVKVPEMAESVAEGDVKLIKKVGDHVAQDEVVMEIETDKTSVQVPAPGHGIIKELLVTDGQTIKPGAEVFTIDITGVPPAKDQQAPSPGAPAPAAAAPAPQTKPAAPLPAMPTPSIPTGARNDQRVKMSKMRQKIAQRLKESQNTTAMLTTFNELDMTNIIQFRKEVQDEFQKKYKIKLGFMSAFMKASAYALLDLPSVNAVIEGNEVVYRDYVDISVAVATPKGLVVPVVKNVHVMNFAEIEIALALMGDKARKGLIENKDMEGGTFTVSNGGVFGSMMSTPIINMPQSAILGMHATFDRPMAINKKVEIRPMMYIALSYDHRIVDGREAVYFLKKIKSCVEDPRMMLAGL